MAADCFLWWCGAALYIYIYGVLKFQTSPPLAMPHIPQSNNIVDINILEEKLSLYEILNVSDDASLEEIKVCDDDLRGGSGEANDLIRMAQRAYKKLILEHHPDKNVKDREGSTRRFTRIQEAYEVCLHPVTLCIQRTYFYVRY